MATISFIGWEAFERKADKWQSIGETLPPRLAINHAGDMHSFGQHQGDAFLVELRKQGIVNGSAKLRPRYHRSA